MTVDTLREIIALYARFTRLTQSKKRNQADNAELYMITQQLTELGLEVT